MQVVVHVDGGARGNPGPAAAAAVVSTPDGRVLDEAAVMLGRATNNVAEYRGLLLGLERAAALGATEVDVVCDSELVARQVDGSYKVKNADLQPLHAQAKELLGRLERWSIRSVPRAENATADALVNRALDGEEIAPSNQVAAGATVSRPPIDDLLRLAHQADELWLQLLVGELTTARDELAAGRPQAAVPRLRRIVAVERLLLAQLEALETIEEGVPVERRNSRRLHAIDWLSGERDRWPRGGEPPPGPSLYEAFRAGLELPEDRDRRLEALAELYRDHADDPLRAAWHEIAELLVEHDESTARRRPHQPQLFPELWDARPEP